MRALVLPAKVYEEKENQKKVLFQLFVILNGMAETLSCLLDQEPNRIRM